MSCQSLISCGYDVCMETNTNPRPSRKNNPFLPRTIIFVHTKQGMEPIAKDYAPQRWVKSISKTGELTYTTDPRMARRFKTSQQASEVCKKYATSIAIELFVDTLRYTASEDDCGFTYHGFFNGKTGLNYDLNTNQPVQLPASVVRMNEILNK